MVALDCGFAAGMIRLREAWASPRPTPFTVGRYTARFFLMKGKRFALHERAFLFWRFAILKMAGASVNNLMP